MEVINRFGSGQIYSIDDVIKEGSLMGIPQIYCTSTACMSVTSDMMSGASAHKANEVVFTSNNSPRDNNIIIVLGCQVTHLAIQNDIDTIERLHEENPEAAVYMGGCLAYRFDIELPSYVKRLECTRAVYEPINENAQKSIHWEKPFWVKDFKENGFEYEPGHLFRDRYPLKIGAGCKGKCKYCTIRDTRGESYETDAFLQVKEFLDHDRVVLISDSPTEKQINDWAYLAKRYNKPISIRNVEPHIAWRCTETLLELSEKGLLDIFHCPVQHNDRNVLIDMHRDPDITEYAVGLMRTLSRHGTMVATNIIINYTVSSVDGDILAPNPSINWLKANFAYWSWNPYFNQEFSVERARHDQEYYFNSGLTDEDILNRVNFEN